MAAPLGRLADPCHRQPSSRLRNCSACSRGQSVVVRGVKTIRWQGHEIAHAREEGAGDGGEDHQYRTDGFPANDLAYAMAYVVVNGYMIFHDLHEVPYEKDYDAIAGEGPLQWARRFDLSPWALFTARFANRLVGGATIAFDTPGLTLLEGRRDLAILWDIRVAPDVRRQGVGSALFHKVEAWARLHGCRQLKIETQNTNVHACRFYERQGCQLRAMNRAAYPELPEEIQLLWYKDLWSSVPD